MKEKYLTKHNIQKGLVLLLYVVFNGVLLWRHEMWRDEINVWLMGRDLSIAELFREIKYQGHPCLWYLLIMPFVRLGFPCRIMGIISLTAMTFAAGLYLHKAPFNFWIKSISLFSPIFTYYYAEIARGYCLVALLIVVLACFHPKRNDRPFVYGILLGLLVQADTIALPIAGMLSLMWLGENTAESIKEKKFRWLLTAAKGLWIPLLSLGLWILQFYQVSDSPVFEIRRVGIGQLIRECTDFSLWILERLTGIPKGTGIWIYAITGFLVLAVSFQKKRFWPILVMLGTLAFQCLFSRLVYELNIWHFISLCFVYIWMLWILGEEKEDFSIKAIKTGKWSACGLQLVLLLLSVFMFGRWNYPNEASSLSNALWGSYSDGVYAARFLQENLSTEEVIVTANVPYTSTIWGFAKEYRAYFAGSGQLASYADWSKKQSQDISFSQLMEWVAVSFPEKESFVFIDSNESYVTGAQDHLSENALIYRTATPSARQEDYSIYRVWLKENE